MYRQPNFLQLSLHSSLSLLGVIKNPKHRITYLVTYFVIALLLLIGSIFGLLACRDISAKLHVLSTLLIQITAFLMFNDTLVRRESIIELLKRLKEGRHADYILERANTTIKGTIVWYMIPNISLFFLVFVPSMVYYAHPGTVISDKKSIVVPYWFSCGDDDGQETNATWYLICLPVRTKSRLVLTNILLTSGIGVLGCIAFAQLIVYIVSIKELLIHTEIFASLVQKLNTTMEGFHEHNQVGKGQTNKILRYQQNMHDQLIKIIQYQQFIKSCILESIRTWKLYNALYVCDLFAAVALMLLVVVQEKDEELFLAFRMACICAMCFHGFVLICVCGHIISSLNEIIFNELCTIPWYQQNTSIQFRKLYVILLAQNMESNYMKMLGVYRVNLYTIFSLIKSAYSLLNMLLLLSN